MRKAIIDIGSNTINLLIGELKEGRFKVLEDQKNHARLARGGINNNTLTDEAFQRGMDALKAHTLLCRQYGLSATDIVTYATASIRAATNGDAFAKAAWDNYALEVRTIDGDTEALLIHAGVKNGFPLDEQVVLIMDIGGGSVEFIITNKTKIFWKQSFSVGVTKLLDFFKPSDPPLSGELEKIKHNMKDSLLVLFQKLNQYKPNKLVGSSGSFDTIRAMIESDDFSISTKLSDPDARTWFEINKDLLLKMADDLSHKTTEERKQIKGMDPMRAEYFPLAFVLIKLVLEQLPQAGIYQCSYALKEGAFFYHFA